MTDSQLCPTCRKPLKSEGGGLITQMVSVCHCSSAPTEADERAMCASCKMPIGSRRSGSLTQFIFQESQCRCDQPQPIDSRSFASNYSGPGFEGFVEDPEEAELEVDPNEFPIERFKPIEQLGQGGAGSVYLCRDKLLRKKVALKLLRQLNSEQLIAFQQEAKSASKLNHPNIIKVLDFGATTEEARFDHESVHC